MSNFICDVLNSDALLEEIDDYIEKWHESETDLEVYDYLGMTKEEYFLWVENDFYLKYIVNAHQQKKTIQAILKNAYSDSKKMAARAPSPEEAKKMLEWLKEKGYK